MRARWAPAWARLIRPGGELVTLMFPLPPADGGAAMPEPGPPWPLTPELYRDLLLTNGAGTLRRSNKRDIRGKL